MPLLTRAVAVAVLLSASSAHAQAPAPGQVPAPAPPALVPGVVPAPAPVDPPPAVVPPQDDLIPKPVEPKPTDRSGGQSIQFVADPVGDGGIVALAIGVSGVLALIESTGEIRPQQPAANAKILSIDRLALEQTPSKAWGTASNFILYGAGAFALADPFLSGRRDGLSAGFVDAVMYVESIAITAGVTDLAKLAIRRPRPSAYVEQARLNRAYAGTGEKAPDITETNAAQSFFSGHTSVVAAIGATASYVAFSRAPAGSARPWITLAVFTALTAGVGVGRVRSGKHFPTDVITGVFAGAGIGALVPHIHRSDSARQRPVWIGFSPDGAGAGGVLSASGSW